MTDEKFFAWLDGELDPAEAAEMEARVAIDPALARLAEQHRALSGTLRAAFDPIAEAPVPQRLQPAFGDPAEVVDLRARREAWQSRWASLPQWAAMAATLAVGILVGTAIGPPDTGGPVELRNGKIYAAAGLDDALETQLASAGASGDVRVALTFRDQAGSICRSFSGAAASGLACREGDDWRLRGLFAAPEGQGGDFRMAAGTDPNLAALIDTTIAGEPLDAAAERAAKQRGWR
jgi:hypothetical protein